MPPHREKDRYKVVMKIDGKTVFKKTGQRLEELKVHLNNLCELEHSGAEGQIIEISTGAIVYRCNKQTIIDQ